MYQGLRPNHGRKNKDNLVEKFEVHEVSPYLSSHSSNRLEMSRHPISHTHTHTHTHTHDAKHIP